MAKFNENYLKLHGSYLFPEIAKRVNSFKTNNPDLADKVISCGIGDVTEPLPKSARDAMHNAVDELGNVKTFRGYGPSEGYDFLRKAIVERNYLSRGAKIAENEIFVSDGAKCDCANILDIFPTNISIAVMNPVYPVYVDTNVMVGNAGEPISDGKYSKLIYLECKPENNFTPSVKDLQKQKVDIIYLCYPNNPTGSCASKENLQEWVEYALNNNAIILYDAAYKDFIQDDSICHSIYEIENAQKCAIEFCSFSKNGGFTGVRCAWTVVPNDIKFYNPTSKTNNSKEEISLNALWMRRQNTKFNGVSYIVQRAAEAILKDKGQEEVNLIIDLYMNNAKKLKSTLENAGFEVFGGNDAPYLWVKCKNKMSSWDTFDYLLSKINVICTPGSGFGSAGEGFFRLSAFNSKENVAKVCERIQSLNL